MPKKPRNKTGKVVIDRRHLNIQTIKRWFVLANRKEATIYQEMAHEEFVFVDRLPNTHDAARMQDTVSDSPGRGFSSTGSGTIRHALDRAERNRQDQPLRLFASEISRYIESARKSRRMTQAVMIAEPRFLGHLRKALSKSSKKVVVMEMPREFQLDPKPKQHQQILRKIGKNVAHAPLNA